MTAAADLAARVGDIVERFVARVPVVLEPATVETLRTDVLELAIAKQPRPRRERRPWGRRS